MGIIVVVSAGEKPITVEKTVLGELCLHSLILDLKMVYYCSRLISFFSEIIVFASSVTLSFLAIIFVFVLIALISLFWRKISVGTGVGFKNVKFSSST